MREQLRTAAAAAACNPSHAASTALRAGQQQARCVQSCTHLALYVSLAVGLALILRDVLALYGFECRGMYCVQEVLDFCFIAPCTWHILQMLAQFDHRRQERQKQIEEKREHLRMAYCNTVEEMDALLNRSLEVNAGLAEGNFRANCQDFIRFMETVEKRCRSAFAGLPDKEAAFLEEFRVTIRHWLKVFEEASVDPVSKPMLVEAFAGELDLFRSVGTLVPEMRDRIQRQAAGLKILDSRRDADARTLNALHVRPAVGDEEAPETLSVDDRLRRSVLLAAEAGGRGVVGRAMPSASSGRKCSWLKCCRGGAACQLRREGRGADHYPFVLGCACFELHVLGKDHCRLLVGFVVGSALTMFNALSRSISDTVSPMEACVKTLMDAIYVVCLAVLLAHVENISALLILDREVRQWEEEKKHVDRLKKEMADFWGHVQQLMDLWLYRTIPRLDLMKEIHHKLENDPPEELAASLRGINRSLESLQGAVGSLKDWQLVSREASHQEELRDAQKFFARRINSIIRVGNSQQDLDGLVSLLDSAIGHVCCCKVSIRHARGLPSAAGLRCACEIAGKPEKAVQTPPCEGATSEPAWDFSAELREYTVGDSLSFRVFREPAGLQDSCAGKATLQVGKGGFEGELALTEVPKGMPAYLSIHVAVAVQVEVTIVGACGLQCPFGVSSCDAYVICSHKARGVTESRVQTEVQRDNLAPRWGFVHGGWFVSEGDILEFEARAARSPGATSQDDTVIGTAVLEVSQRHLSGERSDEVLPLSTPWPQEPRASLEVRVALTEGLRALASHQTVVAVRTATQPGDACDEDATGCLPPRDVGSVEMQNFSSGWVRWAGSTSSRGSNAESETWEDDTVSEEQARASKRYADRLAKKRNFAP